MTISNKFSERLLYLVAVSLTLSIFQYHRISLALVLLVVYMFLTHGNLLKIEMSKSNSVFLILGLLSIVSTGICFTSDIGDSWKLSCIFNEALFVVLVVFKVFYSERISSSEIGILVKGLKAGCLLNLFWSYSQLALYNLFGIDINDLIFHQTLHLIETASAYKDTKYCLTGFGWHPAQLLPIIVLSYFMFDNFIIKILLIGVGVFSNNSTCLCAVFICVLGSIFIEIYKNNGVLKARRIACEAFLLFVLIAATLINNNVLVEFTDKITELSSRFGQVLQSSEIEDTSTFIHVRYYTYYPTIFENQNILERLFGIGYECSGYPYTRDLNQYTVFNDWIPETDYINFLIGRGLIWTLLFYGWMIFGFFKARKISPYYFLYMLIVVGCGVLYNNQFWWAIIIEIIMLEAVKQNQNIWNAPLFSKIKMASL